MVKSNITMSAIKEMRHSLLNQIKNGSGAWVKETEKAYNEYKETIAKSIEDDLIAEAVKRYPALEVRKTSACHISSSYKSPEHVRVELTIGSFPRGANYESAIAEAKAVSKKQVESVENWYNSATRSLINSVELPIAPIL